MMMRSGARCGERLWELGPTAPLLNGSQQPGEGLREPAARRGAREGWPPGYAPYQSAGAVIGGRTG